MFVTALLQIVYAESNGHVTDGVTRLYDITVVT